MFFCISLISYAATTYQKIDIAFAELEQKVISKNIYEQLKIYRKLLGKVTQINNTISSSQTEKKNILNYIQAKTEDKIENLEELENFEGYIFESFTDKTYYIKDIYGIKFQVPDQNKLILEDESSTSFWRSTIIFWDDTMSYLRITIDNNASVSDNWLYNATYDFYNSSKQGEASFAGLYQTLSPSKVQFWNKDAYLVSQYFKDDYTKWFYFIENNGFIMMIELDSRMKNYWDFLQSVTFY